VNYKVSILKSLIIAGFLLFVNSPIISQTLDDYIGIAIENNSSLKVKYFDYSLAQEKVNETGAFESTEFDMGVFTFLPETDGASALLNIGVSQELPWLGEHKAEKKLQKEKAIINQYDIATSEKELTYQIKELYYSIYEKQAIREVLKTNKEIVIRYERMATNSLESAGFSMEDILKIRIQKNELHSRMFQTYNEVEALSKNFNRLLERDEKTVLIIPNTLSVLDIPVGIVRVENHPYLLRVQQLENIYNAEEDLVEISRKPEVSLGLEYVFNDQTNEPNSILNGKDILIPRIEMKIPVFNHSHKSQKQQIEIKQDQLFYQLKQQKNKLEVNIEKAQLSFDNAVVRVVAAQKNATETQRTIDLLIISYETESLNYSNILRLQMQKLNYELMEIEATKDAFIAKSRLEFLSE